MQQIRIHRPRARREHRWYEVLPPDPRDPDVVWAKALALTGDRAGQTTARQSPSPRPAATAGYRDPPGSPGEGPTSMHSYRPQESAEQTLRRGRWCPIRASGHTPQRPGDSSWSTAGGRIRPGGSAVRASSPPRRESPGPNVCASLNRAPAAVLCCCTPGQSVRIWSLTCEVLTFGADLGKRGPGGGLPTG